MGLFKRRSRELRAENTGQGIVEERRGFLEVDDVLKIVLGLQDSKNRIVTRTEAESIPVLADCMEFITGIASSVPIRLYRVSEAEEEEVLNDQRLALLNEDTGDLLTGAEWKKAFFRDYLLSGSAWAFVNRRGNAMESLHYVDTDNVQVMINEDPIYKIAKVMIGGASYRPDEFIHMARNSKDGVSGVGVVTQHQKYLAMALNYTDFENTLVRAGGNKRGFLQSERKLGVDELKALKSDFEKVYGNDESSVVVLNKGTVFQPASSTSVEMQLSENKGRNREEICSAMCLSVPIIMGKATEDEFSRAIKTAIMPLLDAFEKAVNRAVLLESEKGTLRFACDTRELQAGDMQKRYAAYSEATKAGWLSKNEIRYREKMKPVDGLNVFAMSLGDVLYDPETKRYYVTNTGKQVDMQSINPESDDETADNSEDDPEKRYNHNHGSDGRFTTGSGGGGVDKGHKNDTMGSGRKTKYAPSPQRQHKGLQLKPEEYTTLCGEFNTRYPKASPEGAARTVYKNGVVYRVVADGYGGLVILSKKKY